MLLIPTIWLVAQAAPDARPTAVSQSGTVVTGPPRTEAELLAGLDGFMHVVSCPDGSLGMFTTDLKEVVLHRLTTEATHQVTLDLPRTSPSRLICTDDRPRRTLRRAS